MADEEFGGVDDEGMGSAKKPLNLKLIIIVVVVAGIMGAGGFFAGKILTGKGGKETQQDVKKEEPAKKEEVKTETKVEPGKENGGAETKGTENTTPSPNTNAGSGRGILALEPFTVNLNDPFGRRYVETELKLVVDRKELIPKIKDNELIMPKIRNEILMTLSSKSYNDLRTVAGKVTLMEEIQMRINEVLKQELGVEPIVEVLQTKFIMQ